VPYCKTATEIEAAS